MARSMWRLHLAELRKRLPRGCKGRAVAGIIETVPGAGEGGLDRICGISYRACQGYDHPLDGQYIDFGEYGIRRDQVPPPWRELLDGDTFTFELDSPDQDR